MEAKKRAYQDIYKKQIIDELMQIIGILNNTDCAITRSSYETQPVYIDYLNGDRLLLKNRVSYNLDFSIRGEK